MRFLGHARSLLTQTHNQNNFCVRPLSDTIALMRSTWINIDSSCLNVIPLGVAIKQLPKDIDAAVMRATIEKADCASPTPPCTALPLSAGTSSPPVSTLSEELLPTG